MTKNIEPEEVMTASEGCGLAGLFEDREDCGYCICIYVADHDGQCKCLNCSFRFDGEIYTDQTGCHDILGRDLDEHGQPIPAEADR